MSRLAVAVVCLVASGCGIGLDLDPVAPPIAGADAGRMRRDAGARRDAAAGLDAAEPLDGDLIAREDAAAAEAGSPSDAGDDAATGLLDGGTGFVDGSTLTHADGAVPVDASFGAADSGSRADASAALRVCNRTLPCGPMDWCDTMGTCGAGVCRPRPTGPPCSMMGPSDIYCGCDGLVWTNPSEAACAGTDLYEALGMGCCWTDAGCGSGEVCLASDCATRAAGGCVTRPTVGCFRNTDCGSGRCLGASVCGCAAMGCTNLMGTCAP